MVESYSSLATIVYPGGRGTAVDAVVAGITKNHGWCVYFIFSLPLLLLVVVLLLLTVLVLLVVVVVMLMLVVVVAGARAARRGRCCCDGTCRRGRW